MAKQPLQPIASAKAVDWLVLLTLTGLWVALALIVDPRGDFPLVDDWSYARSVKTLVEQHRLEYDGWATATLFFQVLYGALFCLPFGFSFEALRLSALVAGLAGGLGTYVLLRQVSTSWAVAAAGSLVLMLNPVYFQYSFTFMTDVPFVALAVISAVFFVRALRTASVADVAAGTVLACAATLVRQIGLAMPLGYCLALIAMDGFRRRTVLLSGMPVIVTAAVLVVYNAAIEYLHMTPALAGAIQKATLARLDTYGPIGLLAEALKNAIWLFTYLACYVLPFLVLMMARKSLWRDLSGRTKLIVTIACAGFFFVTLSRNLPPRDPLAVFRIAPMGLLSEKTWGAIEEPYLFRQALSVLATAAAAWMAAIVAVAMIRYYRRHWTGSRPAAAAALFGTVAAAAMLAPLVPSGAMERYLIPAVPLLLLALAAAWEPAQHVTTARRRLLSTGSVALLTAYAVVAVVYMHDFMIWNRARWGAVEDLVRRQGIDPSRIDGGLSVNGWYLFPAEGPLRKRFINWRFEQETWWRNKSADYLICFTRCPGTSKVVWMQRYVGWLPGADGAMVIARSSDSGDMHYLPPRSLDHQRSASQAIAKNQ